MFGRSDIVTDRKISLWTLTNFYTLEQAQVQKFSFLNTFLTTKEESSIKGPFIRTQKLLNPYFKTQLFSRHSNLNWFPCWHDKKMYFQTWFFFTKESLAIASEKRFTHKENWKVYEQTTHNLSLTHSPLHFFFLNTAILYREVQGFTGKSCNENRIPAMRTGWGLNY